MRFERVYIPSAADYKVSVDLYIPSAIQTIDPEIQRPAILICPGGGYSLLCEREAEPVALRFLPEGFNCFVVWYRVAPNRYPLPQQDIASAVAWIRSHAKELHADPNKIALLGFSAGGHAAGCLGTQWHHAELWQEMGLSPDQVRPNAMVLCYPVITSGLYAHRGSFVNLSGSTDTSQHISYSLEKYVTENCPPTFLWHTFSDDCVPVENTLMFAEKLRAQQIEAEIHIFPTGGHGLSLCNEQSARNGAPEQIIPENAGWPVLAGSFLRRVFK